VDRSARIASPGLAEALFEPVRAQASAPVGASWDAP
jgi:hypothetical protein